MKKLCIIKDLLRILTHFEIDELTTESVGGEKVSLTKMLLDKISKKQVQSPVKEKIENEQERVESKAKIIPFGKAIADDYKIENIKSSEKVIKEDIKNKLSTEDIVLGKQEEEIVEEKIDSNVFILDEQRKSKESQRKLREKEIVHLYQQNAAVAIDQERINNKDLSKSTDVGVLINKRRS